MASTTVGRPKTLEEGQQWLRERLAQRRNPMVFCDAAEAEAAIARLGALDSEPWASVWGEVGTRFQATAEAAEARGDVQQAADAYFQAHAFYFLARYPCANHPSKQVCAVKARENYLNAARYFEPALRRVAIPFDGRSGEGNEVIVYVRQPRNVSRAPVAMVWGGVDSWKEERHEMSEAFLKAGFATVAIDMPGTGESPLLGSPDGERQYTPVFEWIRSQPSLDGSRIACIGMSFGGYWAAKLAHTHREYLAAAVCWGGGIHYNFQPAWAAESRYADSYLTDLSETRGHALGARTFEEYVERVGRLSLLEQGLLDRPCAPLLYVNGRQDRQVPIQDVYLLIEHGDPKSVRLFPGGHMGQTPQTLPTIIWWLREKLAVKAPGESR